MITAAQFLEWLGNPSAQRATLYKVWCVSNGATVVRKLSNRAILANPSDDPYLAVIAEDLETTEEVSLSGDPKITLGRITVHNINGEFDSWYDDVWTNQRVEVYVGDISWDPADFQLMHVGALADIDVADDRHLLAFRFRDALQWLNSAVTETKLSDGSIRPSVIGEVLNVTPRYDSATDRWYYSDSPSERLIEVRTDGKRRLEETGEITNFPAEGCFRFNVAIGGGAVTCSVQGNKWDGTYRNTIAQLIQLLATRYGREDTRFTANDLDAANLAAFDQANPQPVGLATLERVNVVVACGKLAASKGAQMIPSRKGKLRLIQYDTPAAAQVEIPVTLQAPDGRVTLVSRTTPVGAVKVAYCRNYTPQPNLGTSLPPAHKQQFADEWRTVTELDQPTIDKYQLSADPAKVVETQLLARQDAIVELRRLLAIQKVPRKTYRVPLLPPAMLFEIGQGAKLYDSEYGLAAGKIGLINKLTVNYGTYRVITEVTI